MFRRRNKNQSDTNNNNKASHNDQDLTEQTVAVTEVVEYATATAANGSQPASINSTMQRSSVYQEAMEMLTGALVIYIFAELREMARIKGTLAALEPPLTSAQVLQCIQSSQEELKERAIDHEELAKRLAAFHHVEENTQNDSFIATLLSRATTSLRGADPKAVMEPFLAHFDDSNAEQEIVHAIVVNPIKKRITVAFRGSVTQKDFIQDAKCAQRKVPNPVAHLFDDSNDTTETISLHAGFHEYITKKDESGQTRLELILKQTKDLLQQYPGYQVFCTGHSLGGALCTIFGFFAAADDTIAATNNPVVIYSFASPYCGNWKFRYAFMHLERLKRLEHLRVANMEDMVTLLPFFAPKATVFSPLASAIVGAGNLYKHVGIRLQLVNPETNKSDGGAIHSLAYPRDYQSSDDDYAKEVKDSLQAGKSLAKAFYAVIRNDFERVKKHHSCVEYEARMELCKEHFCNVKLSELYADKSLIGDVLDADFKPILANSGERAKKAMNFWTSR